MDRTQNDFLKRFEGIRRRMRTVQLATVAIWSALLFAAAIIVLAGVDYQFEFDRTVRISLFAVCAVSIGIWFLVRAASIVTEWSRPRTAIELETRFPQVGQRVRTMVQYSESAHAPDQQSAAATLIEALEADTITTVAPIQIEHAVPVPRLVLSVVGLAAVCLVMVVSGSRHFEWQVAMQRAMLDDVAYTTLDVDPGNATVDEGASIQVSCDVKGRRRQVVLYSKPAADPNAEWVEHVFNESEVENVDEDQSRYTTYFTKLAQPMIYRAQAGPVASEECRIDVRYPIAIRSIRVEVTSPEYTGLQPRIIDDGNVTALAGSRAKIWIELDRQVENANVVLTRPRAIDPDDDSPRQLTIPLQIDGVTLSMETELIEDFRWSVIAEAADGTSIPDNIFRVRVRADAHPQVSFMNPSEELLVHTLAEVLMQVHATDDYGLSRSGIVFQVNNDEEHTLVQEDFEVTSDAVNELEKTGRLSPQTRAVLEKKLPLEYFSLTQKDCVVYYAFAEDNCPDEPHRSESELRFIDIRPFRVSYRIPQAGEGSGGGGTGFTSLEELIRRQRYLLNRTVRLSRAPKKWGDKALKTVDRLVDAQLEIANSARALADGLLETGADDFDVLFQSEASMLKAVDSLSVGNFDAARLQEQDAQQYLVEARNLIEELLARGRNDAALRRALALLDRQVTRRLRGDRRDQAATRTLVTRLLRLANEERNVNEELLALSKRLRSTGSSQHDTEQSKQENIHQSEESPSTDDSSSGSSAVNIDDGSGVELKADMSESKNEPMNRQQLESRQYDAVTEAQDLQRILAESDEITNLATTRIDAATRMANAASVTLADGQTERAAAQTAEAAEMFRELARHLMALSGREAAQRVVMARNIAGEIADRQRQLADRLSSDASAGTQKIEKQPKPELKNGPAAAETLQLGGNTFRAELSRVAERARTLNDVLRSIAESTSVDDGDAADRVSNLAAEHELVPTLERTTQFPHSLGSKSTSEVIADANDIADRMEVATASLDRLYRSLVTPRIQQIREFEERAVALQERMNQIENQPMLQTWYRETRDLIIDIDEAGLGGEASAEFDKTINGNAGGGMGDWKPASQPKNTLQTPEVVQSRMNLLVEELQQQLQELVLTDFSGDRDQATPPPYRELVERYFKVLSQSAP